AMADDTPVERTVELAATLSGRAISDAAFVYAGLYVVQYRENPEGLKAGIAAARAHSQGVMLFDASHLNQLNAWSVLEEAFPTPATAPHDVPELLPAVRRVREVIRGGTSNDSVVPIR